MINSSIRLGTDLCIIGILIFLVMMVGRLFNNDKVIINMLATREVQVVKSNSIELSPCDKGVGFPCEEWGTVDSIGFDSMGVPSFSITTWRDNKYYLICSVPYGISVWAGQDVVVKLNDKGECDFRRLINK